MADFRKVAHRWINFDRIISTWVSQESFGRYHIKALRTDGDTIHLFDKYFDTAKEAQEYLDEFMAAHQLADK